MRILFLAALSALAIGLLYWPGLDGPLVYDDYANISGNELLQISDLSWESLYQASLSGSSFGQRRPLSMLSFGINLALTGKEAFYLKVTNLVLHLVNAALVGTLAFLIAPLLAPRASSLKAAPIALFVATLWALHPLQVSTVLYVVQRMTQLSTLFVLVGLVLYVVGRLRVARGAAGGAWLVGAAFVLCMPLAIASKESGVLLVAYAWVIEFFALRNLSAASGGYQRLFPAALLFACVAGAVALVLLRVPPLGEPLPGKGFSGLERLMTEPRVLAWYLQMLLAPNLKQMGLIHDDWRASTSLVDPLTTLPAILLVLGLLAGSLVFRRRAPWAAFAIWWFFVGHSLEAAPLALDLVYEHRNYLPAAGLILGIVVAVSSRSWAGKPTIPRLLGTAALCGVAILTAFRVHEWQNVGNWYIAQMHHHPNSPAATFLAGALYASIAEHQTDADKRDQAARKADELFRRSAALKPSAADALIADIRLHQKLQRPPPDDLFDQVEQRIAVGYLDAPTQNALTDLVKCAADNTCAISEERLLRIANAALNNAHITGFSSSQILTLMANFFGNVQGKPRTALTYAKAATEVEGANIASWFALAGWLARTGYFDEAGQTLDELDRRDRIGAYAARRREAREMVARLRESERLEGTPK